MNPAPRSIGLMMILYAAVALAFELDQGQSPGLLAIAVSLSLIAGGVLMLLRRPVAFWVALGAGLFTFIAGLASTKLPPGVRLPIQPIIPIVIGLYVCLRTAIARNALVETRRADFGDRADRDPQPPSDGITP